VYDAEQRPVALRGSLQDITEQREAERATASATAAREAAAREHRIADELQRSLLPERAIDSDHLDVATFYRAGVEGTQVGGDWYDVIELGANRTALVIGDVMGRGVKAAAVMGQLRSAVRAYARLDLPPADILECLDGVVRDLGDDQIVTCTYAVYDPADGSLAYASAGHLPALLTVPGRTVRRLRAAGPPLGTGPFTLDEIRVDMPPGSALTLYTDGLVERRDRDIDTGIDALADRVGNRRGDVPTPAGLVTDLLPDGPDDDVAVLVARVPAELPQSAVVVHEFPADRAAVSAARELVAATLRDWSVPEATADSINLLASELVTNAVLYARPPFWLRLRRTAGQVMLEVHDGATFLPRRQRPTLTDEHGRGLQLVALLADRWGSRPTATGKVVWCMFAIDGP
jgi:anti-sigma regulatory factor (Ser/Thr protein kinase)